MRVICSWIQEVIGSSLIQKSPTLLIDFCKPRLLLLFAIFYHVRRTNFSPVRVFPEFAQRSPLPQKVPTLIELNFQECLAAPARTP